MTGTRSVAPAILALALLGVGHARAQSSVDKAIAQRLFEQGRDLMNKGKLDEACPKLAESYRIDPGAGALLNLALCHEKQGKLASAYTEFSESLSRAIKDGRAEREKLARDRLAAIGPRLPRITVTVGAVAAQTDGLEVRLDGVLLQRPAWGVGTPVDPGEHIVTARAPAKRAWSGKTTIEHEGETRSIEVPPLENDTTPPPTPSASATATTSTSPAPTPPTPSASTTPTQEAPPPPPPPASDGSTQRTFALVSLGVGVVGVGVGTFFGLSASSKWSDAQKASSNRAQLANDAGHAADVSTIGFVVGGLALGAAAVLYLTAPRVQVAPTVGANGAGFVMRATLD